MQNGFEFLFCSFSWKAEVCKCLDRVELQIFYIIKDLLRSLCLSVSLFHLFQIILDEFYWQEGAQVFCPTHVDSESVDKNEDSHTEKKRS